MSDDHKAALAAGRTEGAAVRRYLELLEETRPSRGRKPAAADPAKAAARIEAIAAEIDAADPVNRLQLIQERLNLQATVAAGDEPADNSAVTAAFVASAASWGARKGISYAAWREAGVPASLLREAGISRSA